MQLAGVIEALSGATSPEEVFELVCGAAGSFGYRWVGLFALTDEAAAAAGASQAIVICNYPDGFAESYLRLERHAVDPVLALAAETITALVWDDVVSGKSLSTGQRALDAERRRPGFTTRSPARSTAPTGSASPYASRKPSQAPATGRRAAAWRSWRSTSTTR